MMLIAQHLERAARWAERAKENELKASLSKSLHCRRSMLVLAEQAQTEANWHAAQAVLLVPQRRQASENSGMQTPDGVPSYDAGLSFILRESNRAGPKSRAAVVAGDITSISERASVKLLAYVFGKSNRRVARDLVELYRDREDGRPVP